MFIVTQFTAAQPSMAFVKRAYGRTKQKALETVGRRDATVDIGFNQSLERFKAHYKVMEKFLKDLADYIKAFKTLGLSQNALNEGIDTFYDHTSPLFAVNEKNKQCALLLEQYRQGLDENIDRDVVAPLNAHMGIYKTLKKRVNERDRRKTDFDRFKAEVKALTVHPATKPEKLAEGQHNLAVAKHAYEILEAELMKDMDALHNDRLCFFDPCFATILRMEQGYYSEGNRLFSELVGMVAHIDPRAIHSHVEPITPEEVTMANPKNVTPPEPEAYSAPTPTPAYSPAPTASPAGRGYGAPPQGYQPDPYGGSTPAPQYGAPQGRGAPIPVPAPAGRGGPAGKQARALYPFTAQNPSELSFNPGDVLVILSQDGDWWNAQLGGRTGLIPGNYVQLL